MGGRQDTWGTYTRRGPWAQLEGLRPGLGSAGPGGGQAGREQRKQVGKHFSGSGAASTQLQASGECAVSRRGTRGGGCAANPK